MSYVYFMQGVGTSYYKIGWTKSNIKKRLDNVQICCPFDVEYCMLIESVNPKALEKRLHFRFSARRMRGEWFNLEGININSLFWHYMNGLIRDKDKIAELVKRDKDILNGNLGVKLCHICSKELSGRQRVYCSKACSQVMYRERLEKK